MSTEEKTREPAGLPFERDIQEMERKLVELEDQAGEDLDISDEVEALRSKLKEKLVETYAGLSAWDQVTVARHPDRPVTGDYVMGAFDEFIELHGDKQFGDDPAIVTGLGRIGDRRSLVATARAARPRNGSAATSAARTRRATARRCARCSWPSAWASRS